MTRFAPATRKQAKARVALAGPSGSGKTMTGLKMLYAMTGSRTIAEGAAAIAVIDTERDSADKYAADPTVPGVADLTPDEAGGWGFSKISPLRYDPRELITDVEDAAQAGFRGLLIDSLSHYWFGAGGILELVDLFARNHGGRSMDGWREIRPIERAYIDALLSFPGHVVVCLRSKQRYDIEDGNDGRKRVTKLGMQPDQRDGLEFEFDFVGDIDMEHYLRVNKTRCMALDGQVIHKPGGDLAMQLLDWLAHGEPPQHVDWDDVLANCTTRDELALWWQKAQRAGQSLLLRDRFAERGAQISAARTAPPPPSAPAPAAVEATLPEAGNVDGQEPDVPAARARRSSVPAETSRSQTAAAAAGEPKR